MKTLVIAPHPDDELLGCGGTLLRYKAEGTILGWLLVTSMTEQSGWGLDRIEERASEIKQVREALGIKSNHLYELGFSADQLDQVPTNTLVTNFSEVFSDFQPEEILLPHPGDVHSDHRITFDTASACSKWFRYPTITRVMTYETPSETDAGLDISRSFQPNVFIDISTYLEQKLQLLKVYKSEFGTHPFPRSEVALRSLAQLRGSQSGYQAAESFTLLRERQGSTNRTREKP